MLNIRRRIKRLRARKANVRFRELRSLMEAAGWELKNVKGSHYHFFKPGRQVLTIVNHPHELDPLFVERVLDEVERDIEEQEAYR